MFYPKKSLGQHFLSDYQIKKQINDLLPQADCVIEIGPGLGSITSLLYDRYKKVILIEVDKRFISLLRDKYPLAEVIQDNILKVNILSLIQQQRTIIVGNLPYNISSKILEKMMALNSYIFQAFFTIQNELGQRISNLKGRYNSRITMNMQYFFDVKYEFCIPSSSFYPIPKVDSCFVSLIPNLKDVVCKFNNFSRITKIAFSKRRKKMSNIIPALKNTVFAHKRPEDFTVLEFIKIINTLNNV